MAQEGSLKIPIHLLPSFSAEPPELKPDVRGSQLFFEGKSLLLFTTENCLRRNAINTVTNRWFQRTVLLIAIASTIFVAAHDPLKGEREGVNKVIYYSDFGFFAVFFLEALLKIIAMGLMFHKNAYLKSTLFNINCYCCCCFVDPCLYVTLSCLH